MGIKHLRKILAKHGLMKEVPISTLKGKRVAIDASLAIYQLHLDNVPGSHLRGIFNRTVAYMNRGITPVYFFDGKPPDLKADVCDARRARTETGSGIKIPPGTFEDVKSMLNLMKIECIESPGEAEAQAAHATMVGFCDIVATEDIDALVFGAVTQCFGLNATSKTVVLVNLAEVLGALNISKASFIDLCILLGSDYATTLPGVGPVTALKYIKQHGDIDTILKEKEIARPEKFCYKLAHAEFAAPRVSAQYPEKRPMAVYTDEEISAIDQFLQSKKVNASASKLKTIFVGFE
jgi:flap endonuclease-1